MEQQFILRLPDNLQYIDLKDAKLNKISQKEVVLSYMNNTYPGIICKLPTILESQKSIDNKLYKISDISTMIVIYSKKDYDVETEIAKVESSGITPPMDRVKERRFETTSIRAEMIEEVERKVMQLLQEDAKATKVEVSNSHGEESSADLDMLAAEIENELPNESDLTMDDFDKKSDDTNKSKKKSIDNEDILSINESESRERTDSIDSMQKTHSIDLKERKDTRLSDSKNTIVHGFVTYAKNLNETKPKEPEIEHSFKLEENRNKPKYVNQEKKPVRGPQETKTKQPENTWAIASISQSPKKEVAISEPVEVKQEINSELREIESRINEKQELLNKALNPILKKRFEQAINELKIEYEEKKKEIEKKK